MLSPHWRGKSYFYNTTIISVTKQTPNMYSVHMCVVSQVVGSLLSGPII